MYSDDEEKQIDTIIGEAAIELLEGEAPISSATLLMKLQSLLMTENDARRKKAIFCAIRAIKSALSAPGERRQYCADKTRRETGKLLDAMLIEVSRKH